MPAVSTFTRRTSGLVVTEFTLHITLDRPGTLDPPGYITLEFSRCRKWTEHPREGFSAGTAKTRQRWQEERGLERGLERALGADEIDEADGADSGMGGGVEGQGV